MEIDQILSEVEKQITEIELQIPLLIVEALKLSKDIHAVNEKYGDENSSYFQITQVLF